MICILQRPTRVIAALDGLVEVALVVVAVLTGQPVGVLLSQEVDALVGLMKWYFTQKISPAALIQL